MKSLKVSTRSPECKPGIQRRGVLGAIAAGAALSAAPATSSLFPDVDLTADSALVDLWHQLLDVMDALDANRASYRQAVASLPAWARAVEGSGWPAWTVGMLAEHQIPASLGDRPYRRELEELNRTLIEAAYQPLYAAEGITDPSSASSLASFFDGYEKRGALRSRFCEHPDVIAARLAADKRLAACDARRDQQQQEQERAGLTAIEEASETLIERFDEIISQITSTPHHSPVGTVIRLRVWLLQATEMEGQTLDNLLNTHDAVVVSLVREAEATDAALVLPLPASLRMVLGGEA